MNIKSLPAVVGAERSLVPHAFPYRLFDGDSFIWVCSPADLQQEGVYLLLYDQYAVLHRFDEHRRIDCRV